MNLPENLKVAVASLLGVVAPGANLFLEGASAVLNVLLLVAQLAVAIASALYIWSKWKKNRK